MPRKNNILIRSGTTTPSASDFNVGEPGFDKSAGKLYVKNAAGTMVEIGAGAGGGISDPYDLGSYPTITISAQPSAASVADGASATFSVTATATLPTATIAYQWQSSTDSGSTWANVSGATSSSYSFTASTAQTGYRYRCALTAGLSVVNSSSATLTVTSAFAASAVLLTSGTSYTVPTGATSMKAWAVGSGGGFSGSGGFPAGGCAYKTWSVSGGNTVAYTIGSAPALYAVGANTTVTFGGVTITGGGGSLATATGGGSYSGGDGGATGGSGPAYFGNQVKGGAVGGDSGTVASCGRRAATDVSGLLAAVALAGGKATEDCGSAGAFGSSGWAQKYNGSKAAGYGGGGGENGSATVTSGQGAVVLYFT
jgi:hypothetical protein